MSAPGSLRPSRHYGLYPAIVTDIVDPQGIGRIQVKFPWLGTDGDDAVRSWATLLSPYAEADQGFQVLPEVDTEVVVGFEGGDLRRPYIVGAAWNGQETPPVAADAANNLRVIKTRSGSVLEFDDTDGAARVTLSLQSGHKLVLDDAAQQVELTHATGQTIVMNAGGQIEIRANASVDITAPVLNVHSATANFDGMINCTTVICSTGVVSPMYTPGAGNIW